MASDRVQQDGTSAGSLVDYKAELIQFPKDRIVRRKPMQRMLQQRVTRYMVDFEVTAMVAFSTASYNLEGPRRRTEDQA